MKKPLPFGLVVEGNLTGSSILRSSTLLNEIGPVKARTLRLARRASNFLRTGAPVATFEELEESRLILIHVPDAALAEVISQLTDSSISLSDKAILICETWAPSDVFRPLTDLGAAAATCVIMPTALSRWVVFEGAVSAIRPVRRLLERDDFRTVEIREGAKHLLFAAELLSGVLPVVLISQAEQALRAASVAGKQLYALLEDVNQRMVHDALRNRQSAADLSVRGCSPEVARQHFEALAEREPALYDLLRSSATLKVDEQAAPLEIEGA